MLLVHVVAGLHARILLTQKNRIIRFAFCIELKRHGIKRRKQKHLAGNFKNKRNGTKWQAFLYEVFGKTVLTKRLNIHSAKIAVASISIKYSGATKAFTSSID